MTSVCCLGTFNVSAEINLLSQTNNEGWLKPNLPFKIKIDEQDTLSSTSLAFFIGKTDVTSFFNHEGANVYRYDASELALPAGTKQLIVYDRTGNQADWNEIGTLELKVLTQSGFSVSKITPNIELNVNSKLSDSRSGDAQEPDRTTYNDFDSNISFESEHKKNGLTITSNSNIVSTTHREAALRFGEKGNKAPKVDLSEYIVSAVKGNTKVQLGHISQGNNPLLVNGLSNRGLNIEHQISKRISVGLAAQSGRQITGYNHLLGFTTSKSKIYTGTVGIELLERPGAAKLEVSYINGTTVAESNFDEGQVPTAEDNSGYGLRLTTNSKSGKLTTDTAFARSRYDNPTEDTLEFNGEQLVDVKPTTNNAYYTDIGYKLLSDYKLSDTISTDLSVNVRYGRVDSEYQSLAASPNPDEELKEIGFTGQLGLVGYQAKYNLSRDNLEDIATILTTQTSSTQVSLNTSLKELFAKDKPDSMAYKLLPELSFSAQRVHQYAKNSPATEDSDFNDTNHLPNQLNLTFNNDLTWGFEKWDLGYQTEWSDQDNKQVGRDQADFKALGHQVSVNYRPKDTVTLGLSAGKIRNKDLEQEIKRYDTTYGLNIDWNITPTVTLSASHNKNRNKDSKDISKSLNTTNEVKVSYQFKVPTPQGKKLPGQAYLRYARQSDETTDNEQDFSTDATDSAVFAGVNLSF